MAQESYMTGAMTTACAPSTTLARSARRWLGTALPLAPGLAIVFGFVLLPCLWLVWLSVLNDAGQFGTENYQRIVEQVSYRRIFLTTFSVSLQTVACCLVLGVPLATFITSLPDRTRALFIACILFPLWTSLLVRAYAWLVILQRNGLVNSWLLQAGLIDEPLPLAFNTFATVLGMTHIMLPVFLLPVIGAMRGIDRGLMRAAASMGASRGHAYRTVFLPLALPGILAGASLTFVMSLGFYVTPAILGGGNVQVISMRIARSLSTYSNFGAAAAIGVVLLLTTFAMLGVSLLLRKLLLRR
ncbi:ABC transporter permease [Ancylobacter pratisalsi]|uniref:ABC transporter permease n=1 Tax=Ancylobacter pratisalsi TaxID=1745854 RepID=A0A6P1YID0_9HYPH|nr:ABC transporter permease [Ancylobacter pratisalsi]QIB33098.1 ABC transporter permease [Ancylobacter pratisalsi]